MNILLVGPPISNPFYPPLGLPSLAASIRAFGRHGCTIVDLSIEAIRHVMTPESIATCRDRLKDKMEAFRALGELHWSQQPEYFRVARAFVKCRGVEESLEASLAAFSDAERFADKEARRRAIHVLDEALEILSSAHYPYSISRSEFSCGDAPFSLSAVTDGLLTRSPLAPFMEDRIDQLVPERRPDLIGISINYYGQLIAGLELARHVRNAHSSLPIVVGGSLMPEVAELLATDPVLAPLFDFVCCYEGETALLALLDCLEAEQDPRAASVPNLMVAGPAGASVKLRKREDMSELPTPDFGDLRLGDYLSPTPILPLLTSRGCYWGACAFCTHFHTYGNDYRTLQDVGLARHIRALQAQHDCDHFYFVDESLAPSKARAFAQLFIQEALHICWGTEIRFERALTDDTLSVMARSGCRALSFGLESGSQRVLDRMQKGILVADIHRILEGCERFGIAAHAMCIIGFPGETQAECAETIQLVERNRHRLALLGFSPFTLNVNSIVHRNPEAYRISLTGTADILRPDRNFTVADGLSQKEAYSIYDEVTQSALVAEIDQRTAVATREHLLLIRDGEPPTKRPQSVVIDGYTLPFSLAAAEAGDRGAHLERQARLIGEREGARVERHLVRTVSNVIVVRDSGRILEVDDRVPALLERVSSGDVSSGDPIIEELMRDIVGTGAEIMREAANV